MVLPVPRPPTPFPARFHRWVRPVQLFDGLSQRQLNPSSNAVPFTQAVAELVHWMRCAAQSVGGEGAVVTCGDWDLKTQIPKQCRCVCCPMPGAGRPGPGGGECPRQAHATMAEACSVVVGREQHGGALAHRARARARHPVGLIPHT